MAWIFPSRILFPLCYNLSYDGDIVLIVVQQKSHLSTFGLCYPHSVLLSNTPCRYFTSADTLMSRCDTSTISSLPFSCRIFFNIKTPADTLLLKHKFSLCLLDTRVPYSLWFAALGAPLLSDFALYYPLARCTWCAAIHEPLHLARR